LDAGVERPELRNFNIDIIEETHARRGELVAGNNQIIAGGEDGGIHRRSDIAAIATSTRIFSSPWVSAWHSKAPDSGASQLSMAMQTSRR
jgi:hypothetical protein